MTPQQLKKLQKIDLFTKSPALAMHQEAVALNDILQEVKDVLIKIAEMKMPDPITIPPMPAMPEIPTSMDVQIKGAEVVTIKGERGDVGPIGPKGDSIVGPQGPKGNDGNTIIGPQGISGKDGESIIGPQGKNGKDGSPDTPQQILSKVESLPEGERWKIEDVNNLRKELDELRKKISLGGGTFIGGGTMGRDLIKDIDLSASLDGVTKTFNIQAVWNIITVDLSSFPNTLPVG